MYCMDKELEIIEHINSKRSHFIIKRIFDMVLSFLGIIIVSPIYLVTIIAIKLDSKGQVIFKQTRVGKDGKKFTIYKFRTMVVDAEKKRELQLNPDDIENFVFQSSSDSRITKVGAFLRKSSIDELPQLFNVLIGNMSLVGPRPEIPEVVKFYPQRYMQRLLVTPGITGLAQVSGRGEIELGKTIEYDLDYIKNFSILMDLKILVKTVLSVARSEGAY